MSKLSELLLSLCPNGVEKKALCEIACINRGKRVVKKDLSEEGHIPVFQNSLTPLGFYDQANNPAQTCFIIIAGAAGDMGYSETPFWAADDCLAINCGEKAMSRFLFHVLSSQQPFIYSQVRRSSIPRLPRKVIDDLMVPVPPLDVQAEIVRILDNFTELTAELASELMGEYEKRNRQYEYYLDSYIAAVCSKRMIKLDDCLEWITYGFTSPMSDTSSGPWKITARDIQDGMVKLSTARHTSQKEFDQLTPKCKPVVGDLLLTKDGALGRTAIVEQEGMCINQSVALLRVNRELLLPEYLSFVLQSNSVQEKMMADVGGGTIKHIYITRVNQMLIPVPPIETQKIAVAMLNKVSTLWKACLNEIATEIKARQKQYEYYRDILLTFPELKQ